MQATPGRHLPSVIGCAAGFCAAGSGVGSLVGTCLGTWLVRPIQEGQGTPDERLSAFYAGTFEGIAVGMGVGLVVGVLYAVLVRRARLRHSVPVRPGAA